jgi:hypothetical protein
MHNHTINLTDSNSSVYLQEPYYIINGAYTTLSAQKISNTPCASIAINNGKKIFSNTHNNKVLTLVTKVTHLPLSIFGITESIDTPYNLPQALSKNKTSAIHLLDECTPVIAQNKNIYILKEQFKLDRLSNIYSQPCSYTLGIKEILYPALSDNDKDHITTIDSSDSYLVSISKEGHITSWQKNGTDTVPDEFPNIMHYKEKFFASGIYKADNILCLGLKNGRIAVISLNDLSNKTIKILPNTSLKINWIKPFANELFFATLCDGCKKESTTACCATKRPSCELCQKRNEKDIRNNLIITNGHGLIAQERHLKELIKQKNEKICEHINAEITKNNLSKLCNCCSNKLFCITISAKNLEQKNTFIEIIKEFDTCITTIYPLSDDRIIILKKNTLYSGESIILHNIQNKTNHKLYFNSSFNWKILIAAANKFFLLNDNNFSYFDKMHKISWSVPFKRFIAAKSYLLMPLITLGLILAYTYADSYKSRILLTILPSLIIGTIIGTMTFFIEFPILSKLLCACVVCCVLYNNT